MECAGVLAHVRACLRICSLLEANNLLCMHVWWTTWFACMSCVTCVLAHGRTRNLASCAWVYVQPCFSRMGSCTTLLF